MKIQIYDYVINGLKNIFLCIIITVLLLCIVYGIMVFLEYILIKSGYALSSWIFHSFPWIISFPITFIIWAITTTKTVHEIEFRDFWVRFSVFVDIKDETHHYDEMNKLLKSHEDWLSENSSSLYRNIGNEDGIITYAFLSKTDATAFKLRWIK